LPFPYYKALSRKDQEIYRRSDRIAGIELPRELELSGAVARLQEALSSENRRATQRDTQALSNAILDQLQVCHVQIRVLAARPNKSYGELYGLYESEDPAEGGTITLWMRTAQKKQVVAFKTFLRTLLHELCHHLDYTLLRLRDSFHTEGFFKRESSLFHQLFKPEPEFKQATLF